MHSHGTRPTSLLDSRCIELGQTYPTNRWSTRTNQEGRVLDPLPYPVRFIWLLLLARCRRSEGHLSWRREVAGPDPRCPRIACHAALWGACPYPWLRCSSKRRRHIRGCRQGVPQEALALGSSIQARCGLLWWVLELVVCCTKILCCLCVDPSMFLFCYSAVVSSSDMCLVQPWS